jgi:hypothetical protein
MFSIPNVWVLFFSVAREAERKLAAVLGLWKFEGLGPFKSRLSSFVRRCVSGALCLLKCAFVRWEIYSFFDGLRASFARAPSLLGD